MLQLLCVWLAECPTAVHKMLDSSTNLVQYVRTCILLFTQRIFVCVFNQVVEYRAICAYAVLVRYVHVQMTGLMLQSSDGEPVASYSHSIDDGIERGLCAFLLGILFLFNLDRVPAFTKYLLVLCTIFFESLRCFLISIYYKCTVRL